MRGADGCLPDFENSVALVGLDAVHAFLEHYLSHPPGGT
jgi:hypothetical protein